MLHQFASLPCRDNDGNELCFMSSPSFDKRVRCDVFGNLNTTSNWAGWEVWRFTKLITNNDDDDDDGNIYVITSWTHKHKVLCSNPDGRVFSTENKEGDWEKWQISLHPEHHGLQITSVAHGRRRLCFSGEDLYTYDHPADSMHSVWHFGPGNRGEFYISMPCHNKRLLSSKPNGEVFSVPNRGAWESWIISPQYDGDNVGTFAVGSKVHNKYLAASKDGSLHMTDQHADGLEALWFICLSPQGGVYLRSVAHRELCLACNNEGHVYTADVPVIGECETWHLEPIMPPTISAPQLWTLTGVGLTTLGVAIATPFAVMGVVGAMGFGAEGIVAGTAAAGMMSAEAIAAGGGVVAGGTVATLQSIGAVGLSAGAAAATASAGAVTGLAVSVGAAAAATNGFDGMAPDGSRTVDDDDNLTLVDFPLCAWRLWSRPAQ